MAHALFLFFVLNPQSVIKACDFGSVDKYWGAET